MTDTQMALLKTATASLREALTTAVPLSPFAESRLRSAIINIEKAMK